MKIFRSSFLQNLAASLRNEGVMEGGREGGREG